MTGCVNCCLGTGGLNKCWLSNCIFIVTTIWACVLETQNTEWNAVNAWKYIYTMKITLNSLLMQLFQLQRDSILFLLKHTVYMYPSKRAWCRAFKCSSFGLTILTILFSVVSKLCFYCVDSYCVRVWRCCQSAVLTCMKSHGNSHSMWVYVCVRFYRCSTSSPTYLIKEGCLSGRLFFCYHRAGQSQSSPAEVFQENMRILLNRFLPDIGGSSHFYQLPLTPPIHTNKLK